MTSLARPTNQSGANLIQCFDETKALLRSLTPEEWTTQSLCPDWDCHGVAAHLVALEKVLLGWRPQSAEDPPPFDSLGEVLMAASAWSPDQMIDEASETFAARAAELSSLDESEWAVACLSPVGPTTYQGFMNVRTFDFWVHLRDMTTPLGRLGALADHGGPAAEATIDQIEASIGYIVGKKIGLPDGMSITFHLNGPVERLIHVMVDGRAKAVASLSDATVKVTADSLTFTQLACGRIDPQEAIDSGRISWTGMGPAAAEWGERAARSLRFTM